MSQKTVQSAIQMQYELRLKNTTSGAGYFFCFPEENIGFDKLLSYLRVHPNDEFMHKYLLETIGQFDEKRFSRLIEKTEKNNTTLLALLYEVSLLSDKFGKFCGTCNLTEAQRLSVHTPLIYIKSSLIDDQKLHSQWIELFRANISAHKPLPPPDKVKLPWPLTEKQLLETERDKLNINEIYKQVAGKIIAGDTDTAEPSPEETAAHALDKLNAAGFIADIEMRHVSSLSPCALLRKWRLDLSVQNNRHNYLVSGFQTAYGRGLSIARARASYAMEIVERCSSFASFDGGGAKGFARDYPLVYSTYEDLVSGNQAAMDPNSLSLETPYKNEPLYWLEGEMQAGDGVYPVMAPVMVPAQCVFMFCNLDEISLFSALGSTGLASGNTIEEAKVNALLELIERDGEGVSPYDHKKCFRLESNDPKVASLLADYRAKGIWIQFRNISSRPGVPSYKCFVIDRGKNIIAGAAAHLDAKKAILSAITETPYPYPYGNPSLQLPEDLPCNRFEDLPDYSTGSHCLDLKLLEKSFTANGYRPVYVNLTRKDLGIPVVRTIVPGLELISDFDRLSRVSPRLFSNYLKMFK